MIRALAFALCLVLMPVAGTALAQNGGQPALFEALSRLQRDPAYAGRIVGTHIVRAPGGEAFLYEVRIHSPEDRILIVHLDPASGAVVSNPQAWFDNR